MLLKTVWPRNHHNFVANLFHLYIIKLQGVHSGTPLQMFYWTGNLISLRSASCNLRISA